MGVLCRLVCCGSQVRHLGSPGEVEWHVIIRCDPPAGRHKQKGHMFIFQLPLHFEETGTE